jgi:hypothetical protein
LVPDTLLSSWENRVTSSLLGIITLENMGLVLNPYTRTLHPMKMMLA